MGNLSGKQAQEPCGRGYLNSNRRTSHLCISCSLALVSLRYRPLLRPLSSQCFLSFVLCARSFSAVVSPGIGWVGQLQPHCTDAHPFVYGFSSTPVLKEMLQKLQFSHLFHPLFHLTTSQMIFPFFSFPLHTSRKCHLSRALNPLSSRGCYWHELPCWARGEPSVRWKHS